MIFFSVNCSTFIEIIFYLNDFLLNKILSLNEIFSLVLVVKYFSCPLSVPLYNPGGLDRVRSGRGSQLCSFISQPGDFQVFTLRVRLSDYQQAIRISLLEILRTVSVHFVGHCVMCMSILNLMYCLYCLR